MWGTLLSTVMPPKSSDQVSVRSDIVLQGKEGNGAFGGKGKSIFDVERNGQVSHCRLCRFLHFCVSSHIIPGTHATDCLMHAHQVKYPKPLKQAKLSLDADSQKSATTREAPMSAKSKTARSQSGQVPSSVVGYVSADSKPALNKFADAVLVKQVSACCLIEMCGRLAAGHVLTIQSHLRCSTARFAYLKTHYVNTGTSFMYPRWLLAVSCKSRSQGKNQAGCRAPLVARFRGSTFLS